MKDPQKSRALQACRLLIEAYKRGERDGQIEWEHLDEAFRAALAVFAPSEA